MPSTFYARMDELERIVGDRELSGRVVVDQPYAQIQHQKSTYHHDDGVSKYLITPLQVNRNRYLMMVAHGILDDGGRRAMFQAMTDLAKNAMKRYVPTEHFWLQRSGSPSVWSDGRRVFYTPPEQRRRTQEEINKEPTDDDD